MKKTGKGSILSRNFLSPDGIYILLHSVSAVFSHLFCHMPVNIQGERDGGMAEIFKETGKETGDGSLSLFVDAV